MVANSDDVEVEIVNGRAICVFMLMIWLRVQIIAVLSTSSTL